MSSTSGNFGSASQRESGDRDADLFRRAQAGDRGAFGQLAIRTQDRLFNAILRVVGDREEARELTQETFVKALSGIEGFRGDSQPYTWLFRIGVNLAISHLRKVQRHRTFSLDTPRRGMPAQRSDQESSLIDRLKQDDRQPSDGMVRRETQQQVLAALGRLDVEQRAILVMRDIEGLDYQAMAAALEVPLGTLKSRLFRARLAMKEQLEMKGERGEA